MSVEQYAFCKKGYVKKITYLKRRGKEKKMEIIVKAVTTVESYAEKRQEAHGDCDDVKCKLCQY